MTPALALAMILGAIAVCVAFSVGMWLSDCISRQMWREEGYCATCNRLELDKDKR